MKKNRITYLLLALLLLFAFVLAGCASNNNREGANGNVPQTGGNGAVVNVDTPGFKFQLDNTTIPAGDVKFHVTNSDQSAEHEMIVIKTDKQGSELPTDEQGLVDEKQLEVIDEVEVEPGETKDLSVNLEPGHYVLLCNEPGHYQSGMYLDVTVQ